MGPNNSHVQPFFTAISPSSKKRSQWSQGANLSHRHHLRGQSFTWSIYLSLSFSISKYWKEWVMKHRFSANFVVCYICHTYSCVSCECGWGGSLGWCRSRLFCAKWTMDLTGIGMYVVLKFWCFLHPWHDITCDWVGCLNSVIRNWLFRAIDSVWEGILGVVRLKVI